MGRAPQIWTNTAKDGSGENLLPIVDIFGRFIISPIEILFKPTKYDTKTYTQGALTTTVVYTLAAVNVATKVITFTDATKSVVNTIVWS